MYKRQDGDRQSVAITELTDTDLMEGDVTVAVEHSTVNYKDGLAISGSRSRRIPLLQERSAQPGVDSVRAGILRENCHDQDNRQCPSKDTLTPDGVGPRRTRDTLFNGVVAHTHCARFKSN